jgi:hypothetical protein
VHGSFKSYKDLDSVENVASVGGEEEFMYPDLKGYKSMSQGHPHKKKLIVLKAM